MNQHTTSLLAPEPLVHAPQPTALATPAELLTPSPATDVLDRPARPRHRYWEQLDPASHSLYPVD